MTNVASGPQVTARRVVGTALTIYRRRAGVVAVMSLIVFSLLAVTESLLEVAIERRVDEPGHRLVDSGFWVVSGLWTFGSALFSGLCDTIVARQLGHDEPRLVEAWKRLPYGRLIMLDIVVTTAVSVGMLLLVVPGVVMFTLTCVAAPIVVLERRGVRAAIGRSAHLVRPRFALALGIVTIPVLVEHEAIHVIEAAVDLPFVPLLVLNLVGVLLVLVPVTLCEIVLAHALAGGTIEPVSGT